MRTGPSEIAVVQINRTEYIMKCYHDMVDPIPPKRIYGPEINGYPIVYIGDLTFEIRARAVRHVIRTRGNSRLNKSVSNLNKIGDHIKRHTDLFKYGYISYV